jgi:pathogenesis-related protein 1
MPPSTRSLLVLPLLLVLTACEPPGGSRDADGDPEPSSEESATESKEPAALAGMTELHNEVRAGAEPAPAEPLPDLRWDGSIASIAQAHADRCVYAHSNARGELGENIFAQAGSPASVEDVVHAWGDEMADYSYATGSCAPGKKCGHYTQIVWEDTTHLGCGVRLCTKNSPFEGFSEWQFWVCNYDPPGNWQGEKPY